MEPWDPGRLPCRGTTWDVTDQSQATKLISWMSKVREEMRTRTRQHAADVQSSEGGAVCWNRLRMGCGMLVGLGSAARLTAPIRDMWHAALRRSLPRSRCAADVDRQRLVTAEAMKAFKVESS